jgi:hypothetical protein
MVHFNPEITDGAFNSCMADRPIMKTLLLLVLSMVAAAREATAQDAECVRERAAMVETIRAYARSDASAPTPSDARGSAREGSREAFKRRGPPSQGWRTFLCNHAPDIAAMDLFVVPTIGFDLLFAFVIVRLDRRDLVWINVTATPTAEWVARQSIPVE